MRKVKRLNRICSLILFANDFIFIILSFALAYWLRFYSGLFAEHLGVPSFHEYFRASLITGVVIFLLLNFSGLYNLNNIAIGFEEKIKIFKAITRGAVVVLAALFFYRGFSYSRVTFFFVWVFMVILIIFSRHLWDKVFVWYRSKPRNRKNMLIVVNDKVDGEFVDTFRRDKTLGCDVKGVVFVWKKTESDLASNIKTFSGIQGLQEAFAQLDIDEVIITSLEIPRQNLMDIILECEKHLVFIKFIADTFSLITSNIEAQNISSYTLLALRESPLFYLHNRIVKRLFDLAGSLAGLIIFSPVILILVILIKCDSKGPVFFRQKRVGEDGKMFTMYKFRTMVQDAEKNGPMHTSREDPRRTRTGKFLRRWNLDEIPQLYNVLVGDMSLVGPRPEMTDFVERFKESVPRYMSRHKVKSGLTGWAQVNGLRQSVSEKEEVDIEARIKYDLYYIENWSLWLDVKIIFKTLATFASKNAY